MFLIALSAFVVTSALSGAAPTIGLLIAARLLQVTVGQPSRHAGRGTGQNIAAVR